MFKPVCIPVMPDDKTIAGLPRPSRRVMELLRKVKIPSTERLSSTSKSISLEFCLAARTFNADPNSQSQLGSITFEKTNLIPDSYNLNATCKLTGELNKIQSSVAFVSIGYKSEALQDFHNIGMPFNDNLGIITNDGFGRVKYENGLEPVPGMYCAGWVKRGPTGVIANTMEDAFLTAESITYDWHNHAPFLPQNVSKNPKLGWTGVQEAAMKQGCRPVDWNDWQKIDQAERENGRKIGKPREKFKKVENMLAILD